MWPELVERADTGRAELMQATHYHMMGPNKGAEKAGLNSTIPVQLVGVMVEYIPSFCIERNLRPL